MSIPFIMPALGDAHLWTKENYQKALAENKARHIESIWLKIKNDAVISIDDLLELAEAEGIKINPRTKGAMQKGISHWTPDGVCGRRKCSANVYQSVHVLRDSLKEKTI